MSRFQPQKSENLPGVSAPVCATPKLCSVIKSGKYPK